MPPTKVLQKEKALLSDDEELVVLIAVRVPLAPKNDVKKSSNVDEEEDDDATPRTTTIASRSGRSENALTSAS